jgi:hypothetical protein
VKKTTSLRVNFWTTRLAKLLTYTPRKRDICGSSINGLPCSSLSQKHKTAHTFLEQATTYYGSTMPFWKKKKDPVELAKEWKTRMRQEQRGVDREIRAIEREENRVKLEIKAAAKRGDKDSGMTLCVCVRARVGLSECV